MLKVRPLFYNAASTDAQFYQDFTFDIATYVVPVSIVSLATDETTYPLNGSGHIEMLVVRGAPAWLLYRKALPQANDRTVLALWSATGLPLLASGSGMQEEERLNLTVELLDATQ